VLDIRNQCPDFGQELLVKYLNGSLSWGGTLPFGESEISYDGQIRMNEAYYGPQGMLEMDLYHEAAHALNHEWDYSPSPYHDPYARDSLYTMNYVSFDDNYFWGTCPTGWWDPQ
jgi:hypothetical protein